MKLWSFPDLHLDYAPLRAPLVIPDADVQIVAGDLCRGPANSVRWLAEHIPPSMPRRRSAEATVKQEISIKICYSNAKGSPATSNRWAIAIPLRYSCLKREFDGKRRDIHSA